MDSLRSNGYASIPVPSKLRRLLEQTSEQAGAFFGPRRHSHFTEATGDGGEDFCWPSHVDGFSTLVKHYYDRSQLRYASAKMLGVHSTAHPARVGGKFNRRLEDIWCALQPIGRQLLASIDRTIIPYVDFRMDPEDEDFAQNSSFLDIFYYDRHFGEIKNRRNQESKARHGVYLPPHVDLGVVTLIWANQPGLEVRCVDGSWKRMESTSRIVVVSGKQFGLVVEGIAPCLHRVRAQNGKFQSRTSITFELRLNPAGCVLSMEMERNKIMKSLSLMQCPLAGGDNKNSGMSAIKKQKFLSLWESEISKLKCCGAEIKVVISFASVTCFTLAAYLLLHAYTHLTH